jgi:hypothetical protein
MKVYTVYLNGDQGWTDTKIDGFYNELLYAQECGRENAFIPTKEEFNNKLLKLNIGDYYKIYIGSEPTTIQVKCEEMSEEEFNSLGKFTGW